MNNDEFDAISMLLDKGFKWREPFGAAQARTYRLLLDGYNSDQVLQVLRELVAAGQIFGPTPGEIVARIQGDPSQPTFVEMVDLIFGRGGVLAARAFSSKSSYEAGERDRLDEQAQLDRAAMLHPLVQSFIARQNLRRLRTINLQDPDYGEANRRKLEQDWTAHIEAMAERDVVSIAITGRRGQMGQLDPLAALTGQRQRQHELEAGSRA